MSISRKELITRSARFFKDKPAVVYQDQKLSFAEVNERANRLANLWLASASGQKSEWLR